MFDSAVAPVTRSGRLYFSGGPADKISLARAADAVAKSEADLALVEAVGLALCGTGYGALREIRVEVDRGIAVLWGRVPNYYQKQLAQAAAQKVDGVRGIANGIEVVCGR